MIGYWSTVFATIVLLEHVLFRRGDWARYDLAEYDQPRRLPFGAAALLAFLCAFGLFIPSMDQAWYVGPIAKSGSGDVGIIVGSALACLIYPPLRLADKALFKGRS